MHPQLPTNVGLDAVSVTIQNASYQSLLSLVTVSEP